LGKEGGGTGRNDGDEKGYKIKGNSSGSTCQLSVPISMGEPTKSIGSEGKPEEEKLCGFVLTRMGGRKLRWPSPTKGEILEIRDNSNSPAHLQDPMFLFLRKA